MMAAWWTSSASSYRPRASLDPLDIDDTFDAVHGHQQLSLFNAHTTSAASCRSTSMKETTGKPVAVILRQGKTPAGVEVRTILKHVIGRIRGHWPKVKILVRGDSHLWPDRSDGMVRTARRRLHFWLWRQTRLLKAMTEEAADVLCVRRATDSAAKLRTFATLSYGAKSWNKERRHARAHSKPRRRVSTSAYVVTSLQGHGKDLYEDLYCGRARPRTSSSGTRLSSPRAGPRVEIQRPISSG